MHRKVIFLLILSILLLCGSAAANPRLAVISTYSSATWLPADINQKAGRIIDEYLAAEHFAAIYDGLKKYNRKELAQLIGRAGDDYIISIDITGFYDHPYTATHFSPNIKPSDTVSTVMLNYTIYIAPTDRWITGRVDNRVIYRDTNVPIETAYLEYVRQALPKLSKELTALSL